MAVQPRSITLRFATTATRTLPVRSALNVVADNAVVRFNVRVPDKAASDWIEAAVRGIAAEKVRGEGSVILAPNHFSFMDHFFLGAFIRRKVQFMAKSQLFQPPLQWVYSHGGVFPLRRGHRDEEAFITARAILEHLRDQPGIVLADEVGMGKTYVALAIARDFRAPLVVAPPQITPASLVWSKTA